MLSESSWVLTLNRRLLAEWKSLSTTRARGLQRLVGKRLLSLLIDDRSQSTMLTFTGRVALTTANLPGSREHGPHWLLRISEKNWPPVALMGTAYRWRLENQRLNAPSPSTSHSIATNTALCPSEDPPLENPPA